MQKYKNYINGVFVESQSGSSFKSVDPSTEKEFAEICAAEEFEVNLAVESAHNAFNEKWSKVLPYQRAKYLRSIGDQLKDKAELLGTIETKDTGKLFKETKFQANYIAEYYYYYAGLVDKIEGSTLPIAIGTTQGGIIKTLNIDRPLKLAFNKMAPIKPTINFKLTEKNIQTKVLVTILLNFLLESIFS